MVEHIPYNDNKIFDIAKTFEKYETLVALCSYVNLDIISYSSPHTFCKSSH